MEIVIVAREEGGKDKDRDFVPMITMCEWTVRQSHALKVCDTITMGACLPFPSLRPSIYTPRSDLLFTYEVFTWMAPYPAKGKKGKSLRMYGVKGRYIPFFSLSLSFSTINLSPPLSVLHNASSDKVHFVIR